MGECTPTPPQSWTLGFLILCGFLNPSQRPPDYCKVKGESFASQNEHKRLDPSSRRWGWTGNPGAPALPAARRPDSKTLQQELEDSSHLRKGRHAHELVGTLTGDTRWTRSAPFPPAHRRPQPGPERRGGSPTPPQGLEARAESGIRGGPSPPRACGSGPENTVPLSTHLQNEAHFLKAL